MTVLDFEEELEEEEMEVEEDMNIEEKKVVVQNGNVEEEGVESQICRPMSAAHAGSP